MGFLDHSTNNIIVDAVLTDYGRQKLANQGSAATKLIVQYAFADDEVDYSVITKYGVIVGKEKIEKNTPIFEASTSAVHNAKSLLVSSPNPNGQQPSQSAQLGASQISRATPVVNLELQTTNPNGNLSGVGYSITYDSRFLKLDGENLTFPNTNLSGHLQMAVTDDVQNLQKNIKLALKESGQRALEEQTGTTQGSTQLVITNQVTSEETVVEIHLNYSSNN